MATRVEASPPSVPVTAWSIEDSRALYNIEGWGIGYFDVNEQGHAVVCPDRARPDRRLDLFNMAMDLGEQGVGLPVLLRFSDILRSRIETLVRTFRRAIEEFDYKGTYTLVYPIKVNQQRHVVEEIVQFGAPHGVGLECGSKPELQAVLALSESPNHIIVCNGYKDEEYMRLALMGQKLGHEVFIVIEQEGEIDVLLRVADEMGVTPSAGVRIKLASEGHGRWAAGDRALLRRAPRGGRARDARRRRRRARHRLRWLRLDGCRKCELFGAGIRERRRVYPR